MASIAYKCIRRVVNVLAFLLLAETVVVVGYTFWSHTLSRLEMYFFSNGASFSSIINYLASLTLFMAMVSSTSVNSKSKFTINIGILFGLFYFLFSLGCFLYVKMYYSPKIISAIFGMNFKKNMDMGSLAALIGADSMSGVGPMDVNDMVEIVNRELYVVMLIFTCSYSLGGFITIFMVLSSNCKISTPKKTLMEKEEEIITQEVGFSGMSLRKTPSSIYA
ncbi:uncharacterized protein NEMAJ01_1423 [Nematocida major]|uniref:uncharacterized protein n=1 Tax=Nematocida major TaxID=1912982 RepID=UPI002008EAC0|nr:uncharacterized protein NEMAJ01_1423 [Nematocida major]KAH9386527.1 hypothetical protein NEMAJ01_1423 [Nematocida major]